jgi:UDP-glucose 4-epimerase
LELLKAGYNVIIVDDLSNSFHSVLTRVRKVAEKFCHENHRSMPILHFHKLDYRSKSMRFLLESYSDLVTIPSSSPNGSPVLTQVQGYRRYSFRRVQVCQRVHLEACPILSQQRVRPC